MKPELRIKSANKIIAACSNAIANIELTESLSEAVDAIIECEGKVIVTGMGKAGIAMKKFSATLCSLGTQSAYLHPAESSHGDSGIMSDKDILFVASTSGKTREVIETIEIAQNIGIKKIIGITSHPESPLRDKSDIILDMGEITEPGYLAIAPTASILVMLTITDCIALTVAEEKEITFEEYSKWHHSGYLGKVAKSKSSSESAGKDEEKGRKARKR
jgi:arabinose-5-phosphate isomerase